MPAPPTPATQRSCRGMSSRAEKPAPHVRGHKAGSINSRNSTNSIHSTNSYQAMAEEADNPSKSYTRSLPPPLRRANRPEIFRPFHFAPSACNESPSPMRSICSRWRKFPSRPFSKRPQQGLISGKGLVTDVAGRPFFPVRKSQSRRSALCSNRRSTKRFNA